MGELWEVGVDEELINKQSGDMDRYLSTNFKVTCSPLDGLYVNVLYRRTPYAICLRYGNSTADK